MNVATSLDRFGTVHFSTDIMKKLIGFGDPIFDRYGVFVGFDKDVNGGTLQLGVWLGFVPEIYRLRCEKFAMETANRFRLEKVTENMKMAIIADIQNKLIEADAQVGPPDPDKFGVPIRFDLNGGA